ncbi:hypothetical protein EGH22_19195 [Halomicroarcula sp. F28]|uniref:hypothetical protein n=1 Tax=Haloarcula salinisoli TaxID=2487746 RepID=UPI001C73CABC|nr:hypothetical protein [Halomicroarcula salinisoli]MBX0288462.1 hypothetical protein [Halomicroarcula salinisoli]
MHPDDSIHHSRGGSTVNDTGQARERGNIDSGTLMGVVLLVVVVPPLVVVALDTLPQVLAGPGISWLFGISILLLVVGVPIAMVLEEM